MTQIQKNTANTIMIRMVSSTDHVTGLAGLTLAVTLSKGGGAFAAIASVITDRTEGWYSIELTAGNCNTLGEMVVMATAAGADPGYQILQVVDFLVVGASEVSICNDAISRCGVSQFIESPTEDSVPAILCNQWYATVRNRILREFHWGFATAYVTLADIGDPPTNWSYRYRYPTDAAKIRRVVVPGTRVPTPGQRIPFQIVGDEANSARAILCDLSPAEVEYTKRITDVTLFPEEFRNILAWGLAIEIVMPLTADVNRSVKVQQGYLQAVGAAFTIDKNERQEDTEPESGFLAARR